LFQFFISLLLRLRSCFLSYWTLQTRAPRALCSFF